MRIRFIFNPKAGPAGSRARFEQRLRGWADVHGHATSLIPTERGGHAAALAERAVSEGVERVVAIGGDGTLNEVAAPLVGTGVSFGIVPRGSGNGLARHLKIPQQAEAALKLASDPSAPTRKIDVGTCEGKPFFNVMGFGLDAEIGRRFSSSHTRGLASYIAIAVAAWRHRETETYEIRIGSRTHVVNALLIAIANSPQYGNGVIIAPKARVFDGALDLVAIPPLSFLGSLGAGLRLFTGSIDRMKGVTLITGEHFRIRRSRPGWIHRDGEPVHAGNEVDVGMHPRALQVVVPSQA